MPTGQELFRFQQFRKDTFLLAQRASSIFTPYVKVVSGIAGNGIRLCNQIGQLKASRPEVRGGPLVTQNPTTDAPWAFPNFFECAVILDHIDDLLTINEPRNGYKMSISEAIAREFDNEVITAMFANRITGEKAEISTAFPTPANVVPAITGANADTGMNGLKVLKALQMFKSFHVKTEGRRFAMALTSQQWFELMQDPMLTNSLYAVGSRLERGRIGEWMGVTFIHFEDCPVETTNQANPIWDCDRVELDIWEAGRTDSGPRRDMSGIPEQLYESGHAGAAVLEAVGVIKVLNKK